MKIGPLLLAIGIACASAWAGAGEVLRSDILRQAQRKLAAEGHRPGPADGVMGARTEEAIRDFQQSHGLPPTGALDHKTLGALGLTRDLAAGASAAVGGRPPLRK